MNQPQTTPPTLVAIAWLLVGLPLAWGVYHSSLNAAKLFHSPTAAATSAAPAAK